MKKLITLLTYILLIITTFVIPVNSSIFSLDLANIFEPEVEEDTVLAPNKISLTELADDGDIFRFAIDSARSLSDDERNQLTFTATLTDYMGNTQQLSLADFDYNVQTDGQRTTYSLTKLKRPARYQSDEINATVSLLNDTIELSRYVFQPAENLLPNGKTAEQVSEALTPFYYHSASQQISFPVYTKPLAGKNSFRVLLNSLAHTPNYPGLDEAMRFPHVNYIWYSAGVLQLKMKTSQIGDFGESAAAQAALDNLLNTLEYSKGDSVVNKVALFIDDQRESTALGGIAIESDFVVERTPLVYLPLINGQQLTWLPQPIDSSESAADMMAQIVAAYKRPMALTGKRDIPPLLAKTVQLTDVQVVAETMKLTFNEAFLNYCQSDAQYCATLIEGLALSATSLPFIENIELYSGAEKLSKIGDFQIENPIAAPTYFNVDLDYLK